MPLLDRGSEELVRVDVEVDGEAHWVEIKARPSVKDRREMQRRMMNLLRGRGPADVVGSEYAGDVIAEAEFVALDIAVKAWSAPDPVTPENLRLLPETAVEALRAAMNVHWKERTEEERKNSSGSGVDMSAA